MEVSGLKTTTSSGNVFEESLKPKECIMRNLEKQVKEIHNLAHSGMDNQIKGEMELADLTVLRLQNLYPRSFKNWDKKNLSMM